MDRSSTQAALDDGTFTGSRSRSLLESIESPRDLDRLSPGDMQQLAGEMREFLIDSVGRTGGHLGAGLGVVELTLALHAEFHFNEQDKIVWDVGHQAYPHKLLTGRVGGFESLRQHEGMSGFPDPKESAYDTVKTGHGGTSISTAMGFALAWQRSTPEQRRHAVAVIGDGSLQEGNAFEALNHGGMFDQLPLVVVLNDNGISISPSVGALERVLLRLRNDPCEAQQAELRAFFEELGYSYFGPLDGHDIERLRMTFRTVRHWRRPAFIHVVTKKGKGYRDHVPEKTGYHAVGGSAPKKEVGKEYPEQGGPTFSKGFTAQAMAMAERDPSVHVVTAAMLEGTGLVPFDERFPDRCHDAGMAEQHAVALSGSMALAGEKPICAIYSTFLQRAYDQVFQEVALQRARVLFCMDRGGLVGSDGATHNGVFDISYLRCLPNFAIMSPRDIGELEQMMDMGFDWDGPVAVRFPRGAGAAPDRQVEHRPFGFGESEQLAGGNDGAILAYGTMAYVALEVRRRIEATTGKRLSVINARFVKPLDEAAILAQWRSQPFLVTLEDHAASGGFGSAVAELGTRHADDPEIDGSKLRIFGIPDQFVDHGERAEQLASVGLDADSLERKIARLVCS